MISDGQGGQATDRKLTIPLTGYRPRRYWLGQGGQGGRNKYYKKALLPREASRRSLKLFSRVTTLPTLTSPVFMRAKMQLRTPDQQKPTLTTIQPPPNYGAVKASHPVNHIGKHYAYIP